MKQRSLTTFRKKFGDAYSIQNEIEVWLSKNNKLSSKDKYEFLPYVKKLYISESDLRYFNISYEELELLDSLFYRSIKVVGWDDTHFTFYYYDDHHHNLYMHCTEHTGTKNIMVEGNIIRISHLP